MSYPQPSADAYSANGYKFFRLNTLIATPGDIYESPQSGHAFALGPDSDIANVNIAYYDDQVANFINMTSIGPDRAFVGRLDARNSALYVPANRPGRVMIWPADLYDPNWRPVGFVEADSIQFITPLLDVIEYFEPIDSLESKRRNKTYTIQNPEIPAMEKGYVLIPYWGRKYSCVSINDMSAGQLTDFSVFGVNFAISPEGPGNLTEVLGPFVVTNTYGTVKQYIITEDIQGVFDMLMLRFSSGVNHVISGVQLRVEVSDVPA